VDNSANGAANVVERKLSLWSHEIVRLHIKRNLTRKAGGRNLVTGKWAHIRLDMPLR
jgi:hypothetical protein